MRGNGSAEDHAGRRLPWGGVVAALLVLLVEGRFLAPGPLWPVLEERLVAEHQATFPVERGLVGDRRSLLRALFTAPDKALVAVLGTSRANASLEPRALQHVVPDARVLGFAHAGMQPFELRGLADELAPLGVDLAVLLVSEFDTHRPLRVMRQSGPGSLAALRELLDLLPQDTVWEERTLVLQLLTACALPSYRFREVFAAAGLDAWRRFPAARGEPRGTSRPPFLLEGGQPLPVSYPRERERLRAQFPDVPERQLDSELNQCRSITRGPHAEVQSALLLSTVRALRAAGTRVLLVEGPVSPLAESYYDLSIRDDFRALVGELLHDEGVDFLPLEETGPFPADRFRDLTHLDKAWSPPFAAAVGARAAELLARDLTTDGPDGR